MLQPITVAVFATSGVLFAPAGLLPALRGGHLNVVFLALGVVFPRASPWPSAPLWAGSAASEAEDAGNRRRI